MSDYFISHDSVQYRGDRPDEPDSLLDQAAESAQGSDIDPYGEDPDADPQAERDAWLAELRGDEP